MLALVLKRVVAYWAVIRSYDILYNSLVVMEGVEYETLKRVYLAWVQLDTPLYRDMSSVKNTPLNLLWFAFPYYGLEVTVMDELISVWIKIREWVYPNYSWNKSIKKIDTMFRKFGKYSIQIKTSSRKRYCIRYLCSSFTLYLKLLVINP